MLNKNLKICIILLGKYDKDIVNKIYENLDKETLLLANTDLLHCGPDFKIKCPDDIDKYNNNTIERIKSMEIKNDEISMCGYSAIKTFLEVLKKKNSIYEIKHKYFTSKKKDQDSKNSVGYASMLFYKKTKYPIYYSVGLFNKKEKLDENNLPMDMDTIEAIVKNLSEIFQAQTDVEMELDPIESFYSTITTFGVKFDEKDMELVDSLKDEWTKFMLKTKFIDHIYRENSKSNISAWKLTAKTAPFSLSYSRLDLKIV